MKTFTQADLVSFGNYLLSDERKDLVLSNPSFSIEQARENLKEVSDADLANWGEGRPVQETVEGDYVTLRDHYAAKAMSALVEKQGMPRMTPLNRLKFWIGRDDWKATHDYNFEDAAKKSFEVADIILKARTK